MIYGYVRVSTDKQTAENQKYEINKFCEKAKIKIDYWVCETISGTTDFQKRKLGKLLKKTKSGDILICSEISRLGRSLLQIMAILNICIQKQAQVWTIKDNFRLGLDIQSKVLAFAFSLSAEIERNLISQRTKEALARLKADGKKTGTQTWEQEQEIHYRWFRKQDIFSAQNTHSQNKNRHRTKHQHTYTLRFFKNSFCVEKTARRRFFVGRDERI